MSDLRFVLNSIIKSNFCIVLFSSEKSFLDRNTMIAN